MNITKGVGGKLKKDNAGPSVMLKTMHYNYSQFFPVVRSYGEIYLQFSVRAYSNAHILFSPINAACFESPVYEIVLGAGHNKFCTIRRKKTKEDKSHVEFSDMISGDEWRSFWIRISKGFIEIGKENNDLPFLFWEDPNPLNINYCSFSSWSNTAALWSFRWRYDNEIDGFEMLSCSDGNCSN